MSNFFIFLFFIVFITALLIVEKQWWILGGFVIIVLGVYIINTYKKDIPKSLQDSLDNFKDK